MKRKLVCRICASFFNSTFKSQHSLLLALSCQIHWHNRSLFILQLLFAVVIVVQKTIFSTNKRAFYHLVVFNSTISQQRCFICASLCPLALLRSTQILLLSFSFCAQAFIQSFIYSQLYFFIRVAHFIYCIKSFLFFLLFLAPTTTPDSGCVH